ncbi:MAG: AAA family ATPase [Planctomycetota bacterium]
MGLREAAEAVVAAVSSLDPGPVAIGITGPVGSGKSTLATMLSERAGAVVISTDRYLPDYHETPESERDLPERSDLARLSRDLEELVGGRPTKIPVWSFQTHRREGEETVAPADLIVCEGLHALNEVVRPLYAHTVFVEATADERLERWLRLSRRGERAWPTQQTKSFFEGVAEPVFAARATRYRAMASFIVQNPG